MNYLKELTVPVRITQNTVKFTMVFLIRNCFWNRHRQFLQQKTKYETH